MSSLRTKIIRILFLIVCLSPVLMTPAKALEPDFAEYIVTKRNVIYGEDARQFVGRFRQIVANKDVAALQALIAPDATSSFGGDPGVAGFMQEWGLNTNPAQSRIWQELQTVLDLGGVSKSGSEMTFPYLFTDWPDGYDAFEFMAVTGSRVNLRPQPSLNSGVIRQLSYEIVKPLPTADRSSEWIQLQTHDRKVGYMASRYVRSPIDYRLGFTKGNDGWKLSFFVAGD